MAAKQTVHASIRTIWGLAKCPELALDEEDLYALVERETGREHLRQLTQGEIDRVCQALRQLKAGQPAAPAKKRAKPKPGVAQADALRGKVYALSYQLGWGGDAKRINGMVRRMFGVAALQWLTPKQCSELVEAMKKMIQRQKGGESNGENG